MERTDIDALLAKMTLREKLGQLTQAETATEEHRTELEEQVRRGEVGSVLMSVGATAGNTPQGEIDVAFYNRLQRIAVEESPRGIPLLFGRDVIHGHRTVYPIPLAMAAAFDTAAVRDCYREIAEEATNDSVHWTFAPMLDRRTRQRACLREAFCRLRRCGGWQRLLSCGDFRLCTV